MSLSYQQMLWLIIWLLSPKILVDISLLLLLQHSTHQWFLPGVSSKYVLNFTSKPPWTETSLFQTTAVAFFVFSSSILLGVWYHSCSWRLRLSCRNNNDILITQTMSFYSFSQRLPKLLFTIKIFEFPDHTP